MISNTNETREILKQYSFLQAKAQRIKEERRDKIYLEIPRIKEIDKQLRLTGINIVKAINKHEKDVESLIAELKENSSILQDEKKFLLTRAGYDENYLEDVYQCKYCNDTGFIDTHKCRCFEQKIVEKLHQESQINKRIEKENFNFFNVNFYSDKKIDGVSPKENIQSIHRRCLEFTKHFPYLYQNFLFMGKPGVGKTFMCNCIAHEVLSKGERVIYTMANDLFNKFADLRFDKGDSLSNSEYYKIVYNADLLIIDDLGSEFITDLSKSELFNLLNARIIAEKSTIISTNLTLDKLSDIYTDRIFSRIIDSYAICDFIGDDIRSKKKGL